MLENPFKLFAAWLAEAAAKEIQDYTAMTLATASADAKPSARIVLLKTFDELGFIFYTNLESRKAQELLSNPNAALCFFWPMIDKQIRIEGTTSLINNEEADKYFATRSRESQIGAWASQQSRPLSDPAVIQQQIVAVTDQYKETTVPRPPYWSGFRLKPSCFEFWQRGEHRLHQRTVFYKDEQERWQKKFLYP